MRFLKNALLMLATTCVLALCFALPTLAAKMQDSLVESQSESIAIEAVTLTTASEASMIDLLRFSALGYEVIDYEISVSPEEIAAKEQAVAEILDYFDGQDSPLLLSSHIIDRSVIPLLTKSANVDNARLLWECIVQDDMGSYATFVIDDSTEKIINFAVYSSYTTEDVASAISTTTDEDPYGALDDMTAKPTYSPESSDIYSGQWAWEDIHDSANVLARYYGLSLTDVNSYFKDEWDDGTNISGSIILVDTSGEKIGCNFQQNIGAGYLFQFNGTTTTMKDGFDN